MPRAPNAGTTQMSDIVLSQSIRQNLLSLQRTADLQGKVQNRLATGKKVDSALDNPTSFFTAANLSARAGDLSRLLDGIGQGIKTLEAADNGIKNLTRLVETAQATARQAQQSASTSAKVVSAATLSSATALTGGTGASSFDAGDALTVQVGTGTAVSLTIAAGDTVQSLVDRINTDPTLNPTSGAQVRASLDDFGKLTIETVGGQSLTLGLTNASGGTANTLADLFGANAPTGPVTGTVNASRLSFARQFDALLVQVDQLAKDASYNGVNLLDRQNLRVTFNEDATSSLVIGGVDFSAKGLAIGGSKSGFQSDADIDVVLKQLDAATKTLRAQASTFGANLTVVQTRQDFTKQAILTLNTGSDQLVLSDQNEEGANLLALNTRQQLSTQALSLASQAGQAVLRLFG